MCLLVIATGCLRDTPLVLAANREEDFARPATGPTLVADGRLRFVAGLDQAAGGTWLGLNERGVIVAVSNRPAPPVAQPRSRGLLACDLLQQTTVSAAADLAQCQLASGRYQGANFLIADRIQAVVVHGGDRVRVAELPPGLHLLSHGDVDDVSDPRLARAQDLLGNWQADDRQGFLDRAAGMLRTADGQPPILIRGTHRGTVSSTLLALGSAPGDVVYRYAPGPPDRVAYEDFSAVARSLNP